MNCLIYNKIYIGKMHNEFNGCYIRFWIVSGTNPKLIHVDLTTALRPKTPSYPTVYIKMWPS